MEAANPFNGAALENFRCCACSAASLPDSAGLAAVGPCPEPWAHEVQEYAQFDAVRVALQGMTEEVDHRLWLLFDGSDLVAAGAHLRRGVGGLASREVRFVAVQIDNQGQAPAGGPRYADIMLDHLIRDVRIRDPLIEFVQAQVRPDNHRSQVFLRRKGFRMGADPLSGYLPAVLRLV